jgi:hypothetical protein
MNRVYAYVRHRAKFSDAFSTCAEGQTERLAVGAGRKKLLVHAKVVWTGMSQKRNKERAHDHAQTKQGQPGNLRRNGEMG